MVVILQIYLTFCLINATMMMGCVVISGMRPNGMEWREILAFCCLGPLGTLMMVGLSIIHAMATREALRMEQDRRRREQQED